MSVQVIASIVAAIMFVIFTTLGIVNLKNDKVVSYAFFSGAFLCGFFLIAQIFS